MERWLRLVCLETKDLEYDIHTLDDFGDYFLSEMNKEKKRAWSISVNWIDTFHAIHQYFFQATYGPRRSGNYHLQTKRARRKLNSLKMQTLKIDARKMKSNFRKKQTKGGLLIPYHCPDFYFFGKGKQHRHFQNVYKDKYKGIDFYPCLPEDDKRPTKGIDFNLFNVDLPLQRQWQRSGILRTRRNTKKT